LMVLNVPNPKIPKTVATNAKSISNARRSQFKA